MMERKYEIILYGATGFTGQICCKYLRDNYSDLTWAVAGRNKDKLEQVKSIKTLMKTSTGFKVTAPEGFVAIDKLKGGAVKLVDRMEFSMQNFNAAKNWDK